MELLHLLASLLFLHVAHSQQRHHTLHISRLSMSPANPVPAKDPVKFECQSPDARDEIKNIDFTVLRHGKVQRIDPAKVQKSRSTATMTLESPTIFDAGDYTCSGTTIRGARIHTTLAVQSHPILVTNETVTELDKEREFTLPPRMVQKGETLQLECPVFGHPLPSVKWTKDGQSIASNGAVLVLRNVTSDSDATYTCDAYNIVNNSRTYITVSIPINVKTEWAWILPLVVIIAILVTLILVIIFCEFRKRKQERKLVYQK